MSTRAFLEVIALDVEDAVAAQAGGADRLELVTDMAADGLTPPTGTVAAIRAADRDTLRKQLDGLPGLDTYLTAGAAGGVDDGLPVLAAEAARSGEPGYEQRIMVGGGLRLDHVPALFAAGIDAFHIGGAARPGGWDGPVSAAVVARWRAVLDEAGAVRAGAV
ncbi:hypothetical protein C1I97_30035 [Streptomyces sp. NTH33]|uniref:copper homeostasis protein CutC n=1 Tax=Streptomyces sp. NTH33 TaxID=1735453 RepID=UPI000DAA9BC3|nr:copper homeostasis protein CutC [Streptomyces sp. NTH33]PZG91250.1 hypothetical protein C1I97_30035 [Streptomyces sp. NTH33]